VSVGPVAPTRWGFLFGQLSWETSRVVTVAADMRPHDKFFSNWAFGARLTASAGAHTRFRHISHNQDLRRHGPRPAGSLSW
jgi:hypothetical protein